MDNKKMTQENLIAHFRQEFFQETREILEAVSDDILKLETDPENNDLLNAVFRGIHTIKGSAGSFELEIISEFTHHLEGLLNALRDGKMSLTPELVDVILSGSDQIGEMIELCARGEIPVLNQALIERIQLCLPGDLSDDTSELTIKSKTIPEKDTTGIQEAVSSPVLKEALIPEDLVSVFRQTAANGHNIYKIGLKYTSAHFENGYDPLVFLKNLYDNCSFYHAVLPESNPVPGLKTYEPLHLYLMPQIYAATSLTMDEVVDLVFDEELIEVVSLLQTPESAGPSEKNKETDILEGIISSPEAMMEFIEGATDMVQTAEKAVMAYEENGSSTALDELFRSVHNIKGDADLMGFKELVSFSHAFESVLDLLRLNTLPRTPEILELALEAVDFMKSAVNELASGSPVPPLGRLYHTILHHLDVSALPDDDNHGSEPAFVVADQALRDVYFEQTLQFKAIIMQCLNPVDNSDINGISLYRTLKDTARAAVMVGHDSLAQNAEKLLDFAKKWSNETPMPDSQTLSDMLIPVIEAMEELIGEPKKIGEILVRDGKIKEADLAYALEAQKPVGRILVEQGKLTQKDVDSALNKQKLMTPVKKQVADEQQSIKTMRVDEQKVESFSNLVGEMLIARNTYAYLLNCLSTAKDPEQTNETIKELKENLHLFSRLTNDVQYGIMSLRMIPVRGIFQKFSRVVRDISRKQNKMIQMLTDGEDIEIDKKVADVLSDPLVHLIRNACDHGIETPLERKKACKPEKGTILLKASREGSNIVIRINDDGRGINRKKLLEKANTAGLDFVSEDDPGLLDMIFMPGLSTAEKISDVSGRGVGMDVVKTTIQSLGGGVTVISEPGAGSQITLTIPTSMGIDTVLFVEACNNSYAIPITNILETLKVTPDSFIRAGDQLMFYHRGEVLAAYFLHDLLFPGDTGKTKMPDTMAMVVLKTSKDRFGVIIDHFDQNMEIAVKPLPDMLSELDVISGISILGDGRVLLVINPERLAE